MIRTLVHENISEALSESTVLRNVRTVLAPLQNDDADDYE